MSRSEPRERSKKKNPNYKPKGRWRTNSRGRRRWLKGKSDPIVAGIAQRKQAEMKPNGHARWQPPPPPQRNEPQQRTAPPPKITIKSYLDSRTAGYDDCPHCRTDDVDRRTGTTREPVEVEGHGKKVVVTCGVPGCGQKFWSRKSS